MGRTYKGKQINFKQKTMKITGMSSDEYNAAYRTIKARTLNYNAVAGTTYSPAQVLYLSNRYAPHELSEGIKNILNTAATNPHTRGGYKESRIEALGEETLKETTEAATEQFYTKWGGFINRSRADMSMGGSGDAAKVSDKLESGLITVAEANEELKRIQAEAEERREKNPAYKY